ncbi:MAG: membrane protein insertion efficiency factor YidD [Candidatus Omnitrophica bacterium]|nr:membrane protein insertion efficiency factor YidD [Candidatus Omnitrophota bacterium]
MQDLPVRLIERYQFFARPFFPPACRFWPSCSDYTKEAIQIHGPLKGLLLGAWRLLKCHPLCPGGVDLVPRKSMQ